MQVFIHPRFVLMSTLSGVGRMQNTMTVVALLAAGLEAGYSPLQNSLLTGGLFLTTALSALWKGRAVDQSGHGIVRIQALATAGAFFVLVLALSIPSWPLALLSAALLGLVRNNPGMLMQALWADLHQDPYLQARASAWENLMASIAQTAGPFLAALFIYLGGGLEALIAAGVLASASMLLWSYLAPPKEEDELTTEPSAGLWSLLYPLMVISFFLSAAAGALQFVLIESSGGEDGALLVGIFTAGAASASILYLLWRFPFPPRWIAPLSLLFPLAAAFAPQQIPALFVAGALFASGALAVNILVKLRVPEGLRNQGMSLVFTGGFIGAALGTSLAGLVLQISLPVYSLVIIVAFAVLTSFCTLFSLFPLFSFSSFSSLLRTKSSKR